MSTGVSPKGFLALRHLPQLDSLNLAYNDIGDAEVVELVVSPPGALSSLI